MNYDINFTYFLGFLWSDGFIERLVIIVKMEKN